MIANFWPAWFREKVFVRGVWPRSYCAVDTETSGYNHGEDVVVEWGHCLVEDGEVVDRLSLVIDWTGRQVPPDWWLTNRLRQVAQGMALSGKACHTSVDRMQAEGMKPDKAFGFIHQFTSQIKAKGIPFVLHNHNFDEKMLSANCLQFGLGHGFSFGERLIDTEAIEKASQMPDNPRAHPKQSDSPRNYFNRVRYTRVTGLKSNMDEHCFAKYDFAGKYGVDKTSMHAADVDAYCCHLLMLEYGKLVTGPQTPPVYPTADDRAARRPVPPPSGVPGRRLRGQRNS